MATSCEASKSPLSAAACWPRTRPSTGKSSDRTEMRSSISAPPGKPPRGHARCSPTRPNVRGCPKPCGRGLMRRPYLPGSPGHHPRSRGSDPRGGGRPSRNAGCDPAAKDSDRDHRAISRPRSCTRAACARSSCKILFLCSASRVRGASRSPTNATYRCCRSCSLRSWERLMPRFMPGRKNACCALC